MIYEPIPEIFVIFFRTFRLISFPWSCTTGVGNRVDSIQRGNRTIAENSFTQYSLLQPKKCSQKNFILQITFDRYFFCALSQWLFLLGLRPSWELQEDYLSKQKRDFYYLMIGEIELLYGDSSKISLFEKKHQVRPYLKKLKLD